MGFDCSQMRKFTANISKFAKGMDEFNSNFLKQEALKTNSQIRRDTPKDTGNLRDGWQVSNVVKKGDSFFVDIDNNVEYASFVEDGHYTTGAGVDKRWVPGYWQGDKFVYDPNAKTGMLLKSKFIEGRHMSQIHITRLQFTMQQDYDKAFKLYAKENKL